MNPSYLYALAATFCFALASTGFTHYARKASPMWMNAFKACVAVSLFFIAFLSTNGFSRMPNSTALMAFFISGLVGLNIGDIYLLKAFSRIGPARTLIIFSFQPIFLGVFSYFLFDQTVDPKKGIAIFFMIACLFIMSYEKFRADGHWELKGPLFAAIGVLLDSFGILLTRFAFNSDPQVSVFEGNFYRCVGAITGFVIIAQVKPFKLLETYRKMKLKSKLVVTGAAILGTFISLTLYLNAIRFGNLAAVTAIVGTGPIFAAILESIISKKAPSRYLYLSLILFGMGFYLLF